MFADLERCNTPVGSFEFENDFEPVLVREGSSSTRPAVERAQDMASFLDVCCRSAFDRRGRKVIGDDACQCSAVPQSSATTLTAIDAVLRAQWLVNPPDFPVAISKRVATRLYWIGINTCPRRISTALSRMGSAKKKPETLPFVPFLHAFCQFRASGRDRLPNENRLAHGNEPTCFDG